MDVQLMALQIKIKLVKLRSLVGFLFGKRSLVGHDIQITLIHMKYMDTVYFFDR